MRHLAVASLTLSLVASLAGCQGGPRAEGQPPREPARGEEPSAEPPLADREQAPRASPEPALAGQGREPEAPPPPAVGGDVCPPADRWPEGMACVPGGTFTVGDPAGDADEQPPGEVTVRSFFLDRYEVTNERYAACVARGACPPPTQRYRGFGRPQQPVVAVSWEGARAFCQDAGGRLPTDAEHERAARGPEGAPYAFGDEPADPCPLAVVKTRAGEGCGTGVTADVGSRPAGHYGIFDLAGNVHEWVEDRWSPCLRGCRNECGEACFGLDPRGPCAGEASCPGHPLRSIRGGSWYWSLSHARAAARRGAPPANEGGHRFGFRCARDLPPE